MQESEEIILKRKDARLNGSKPFCPKCNSEGDVVLTNVTLKKFSCLRCKINFALSD